MSIAINKYIPAVIALFYLISILSTFIVYYKDFHQPCSAQIDERVIKQTEELKATTTSTLSPAITTKTTTTGYANERYVTLGKQFDDGRGVGNQIFDVAMMLFVCEMTGRKPAIMNVSYVTYVEAAFDLQISRYDENLLCPCQHIQEAKPLTYDKKFEDTAAYDSDNRTIHLHGFFQSWKYVQPIDWILRRHLVFKSEIKTFVEQFFARNVPPQWKKNFLRVGVHVRRGDVLSDRLVKVGRTSPDAIYFERAMSYFTQNYPFRIQFIVVSNDLDWCQKQFDNIIQKLNKGSPALTHNVTYSSRDHSMAQDLALLAGCNHIIMSTGTFGWWAAWMSKGTTIYFADWPRNGSTLASWFKREDFFPPTWIGM